MTKAHPEGAETVDLATILQLLAFSAEELERTREIQARMAMDLSEQLQALGAAEPTPEILATIEACYAALQAEDHTRQLNETVEILVRRSLHLLQNNTVSAGPSAEEIGDEAKEALASLAKTHDSRRRLRHFLGLPDEVLDEVTVLASGKEDANADDGDDEGITLF